MLDKVREWFSGYLVSKGIRRASTFVVGYVVALLGSAKIASILAAAGVTIDYARFGSWVEGALGGLVVVALNFIKFKTGSSKIPG